MDGSFSGSSSSSPEILRSERYRKRSMSRSRSRRKRMRSVSRSRESSRRSSSRSRRNRSSSRSRRNRFCSRTRIKTSNFQMDSYIKSKTQNFHSPSPLPGIKNIKRNDFSVAFAHSRTDAPNVNVELKYTVMSDEVPSTSSNAGTLISPNIPEKTYEEIESLGENFYRLFKEQQQIKRNAHEEEYKTYIAFPELHCNYEGIYKEFLSEYDKTYDLKTPVDNKNQCWTMFWVNRMNLLSEMEWKKKNEHLKRKVIEEAKLIYLNSTKVSAPNSMSSTSKSLNRSESKQESFSVEKTLILLEQLSTKLDMLGPSLVSIIDSARKLGLNDRGLTVFTNEKNLTFIKMVTEKIKVLQNTAPPELVLQLTQALDWTDQLLHFAKNPPKINPPKKERGLNLMSIAKASVGKDSSFTMNLIKTAVAYEGLPPKSKEELKEIILSVFKIQFEMAMLVK